MLYEYLTTNLFIYLYYFKIHTQESSQWTEEPGAYPGILFGGGGGGSTNSVEDRGQGSGGGSPLVRGSGGSCNFIQ